MIVDGIEVITDYLEADCAYIQGLSSITEYNIISRPTIEMAEDYLENGWRRFGKMFFRPNCSSCSNCIPLRVDLKNFKPSKSMRRAVNKNKDITVEVGAPECTKEHIRLHNEYHKHQNQIKNWPHHNISATEYRMLFCEPMPFAREYRYLDSNRKLVGVAYVDTLPKAYSSLYFFYDPTWAPKSPGIFSIITEIKKAISSGAQYYHLGYYVKNCQSMNYKLRFAPYDLLKGTDELWSWDKAEWLGES